MLQCEQVGEKDQHLFIFLKDLSLLVDISGCQRQRKVYFTPLSKLLPQTENQFEGTQETQRPTATRKERLVVFVCVTSYFSFRAKARLNARLTPPTCASSPAPSCGSCSGCTGPGSSRSVFPVSRPSGPACASSPACSSGAGSLNGLGSPLSNKEGH